MDPIVVSALALVRDRRLLMVTARGRDVLYLPGGKVEPGESGADALVREAREEVALTLDPAGVQPLFTVSEQAHGEPDGRLVEMTLYSAETDEEPRPSSEIGSLAWVTTADADRCPPAGVETLRRMSFLGVID
ncbi:MULTISPECIES: NUDIX domain-containing protein [unclassified Frondihabitans]|uniref:NUDIX hydrolase n=1 Tax=unclassified Frondihabitans TaxID=2626248 RepID=UPI0006F715B5|nr:MULTISPECIES: NUDIX domain-containing protein [unclassified Frondihabitans]KQQ25515.1 NTP pyrophosphohydrolase [Frondihabitans sp. Leaf304]MBF4575117.1 NUDIX domain-containing protein [Frondihabitans sp. VKM Ac-2883]RPE77727.1 ADP-ribose pyrophosphatase YjhB (NUDIX family) [Frondihabitans sp. PhB153]RPF08005.1 ADP-ribose pyrophosphatase YjhB (NUDIX family) [Frondihabitans sp. PhB161]